MTVSYGSSTKNLSSPGTALAFVAFPAAIAKMPGATVWAILFFLMLMLLGLGTECISVHTVLTALVDEYPTQLYKYRVTVLTVVCFLMYLLGIPFLSQVSCSLFQSKQICLILSHFFHNRQKNAMKQTPGGKPNALVKASQIDKAEPICPSNWC